MSDQPPEPEMTPAQRWFRLAEQDLAAAGVLLRDGSSALRIVGFLAQQAAEKALKSGLLALGASPPRIHDLSQLNALYPTTYSSHISDDVLDLLDPWVIDGRYAADLPDLGPIEAGALLTAATTIVDRIRPLIS